MDLFAQFINYSYIYRTKATISKWFTTINSIYMFGLLLLIYLLPLMAIAVLLIKLALWLVRNALRLAFWLARKTFAVLGKGLSLAYALITGSGFSIRKPADRQESP